MTWIRGPDIKVNNRYNPLIWRVFLFSELERTWF